MDPLGAVLELAYHVIRNTVSPYIGGGISLSIEAEIHNKVKDELKKLDGNFLFHAETIFDYNTEELVTTLDVKDNSGPILNKPITIKHRKPNREQPAQQYSTGGV